MYSIILNLIEEQSEFKHEYKSKRTFLGKGKRDKMGVWKISSEKRKWSGKKKNEISYRMKSEIFFSRVKINDWQQ